MKKIKQPQKRYTIKFVKGNTVVQTYYLYATSVQDAQKMARKERRDIGYLKGTSIKVS
jgi:hypothetical protein